MKKLVSIFLLMALVLTVTVVVKDVYANEKRVATELNSLTFSDDNERDKDKQAKKCCSQKAEKKDCTKDKKDCKSAEAAKNCGQSAAKSGCSGASAAAIPGDCTRKPAGVGHQPQK